MGISTSNIAGVGRSLLFFIIPVAILVWTSIPAVASFSLHLALVLGLVAVTLAFVKKEKLSWLRIAKSATLVMFVVTLVGATGWFLSPFFFLMYLTPLYLGFLFTPTVAFSFLAALFLIFSSSIGEVDIAYDVMTLISLLLVVPLVIFLRRKYLVIQQSQKDILILKSEGRILNMNTIGRLLANRITNLGVSLRQPLTHVEQAAAMLSDRKMKAKEELQFIDRIYLTAKEALDVLKKFEGSTSVNVVLERSEALVGPKKRAVEKPASLYGSWQQSINVKNKRLL